MKYAPSSTIRLRTLFIRPSLRESLPQHCCVIEVSPLLRELILRAVALAAGDKSSDGPPSAMIDLILDEIRQVKSLPMHIPLPTDPRALKVCQGLLQNPAQARTCVQWGDSVGASPRTLERLFRRETGASFRSVAAAGPFVGGAEPAGRERTHCHGGRGLEAIKAPVLLPPCSGERWAVRRGSSSSRKRGRHGVPRADRAPVTRRLTNFRIQSTTAFRVWKASSNIALRPVRLCCKRCRYLDDCCRSHGQTPRSATLHSHRFPSIRPEDMRHRLNPIVGSC